MDCDNNSEYSNYNLNKGLQLLRAIVIILITLKYSLQYSPSTDFWKAQVLRLSLMREYTPPKHPKSNRQYY